MEIADGLFAEAKAIAAERKLPMRELIEDGLRLVIQREKKPKTPFKLKDGSFYGEGGMLKDFTWPELLEIIYEGRGGFPDKA
ncbi:MAG: hypothetical protein ACRD1E_06225 [Terriglobales bacterium]